MSPKEINRASRVLQDGHKHCLVHWYDENCLIDFLVFLIVFSSKQDNDNAFKHDSQKEGEKEEYSLDKNIYIQEHHPLFLYLHM